MQKLRIYKLLWVLPLIWLSPSLWAALPTNPSLQFGLSLYGNGSESKETQSVIAGTEIQAKFERTLHPNWQLRLTAGIQLETGSARSRWAEDFRPKQIQRLKQASIDWIPNSEIQFSLGALDQQVWNSPLLLQRQSFPAVYEKWERRFDSFRLSIEAQQAIATDTSSLQPWGNWPTGMPAFYLERLTFAYLPNEPFSFSAHVSHFLYENLSQPTAVQAQFLGNSVRGVGATTSYLYGFQGFEGGFSLKRRFGRWEPGVSGKLVTNTSAPFDKAMSWRLASLVEWEGGPGFHLATQIEFFRAASDAAPAFYNDRVFGHGNRQGFGVQASAAWPQSGIQADARWVRSSVLTQNAYQSALDWVQVQLTTQYEIF